MNELIFNELAENLKCAYKNLFLLAIKKKINLRTIIKDIEWEVNLFAAEKKVDKEFVPKGMDGILFLFSVAKAMDSSVFDILYMSELEKNTIIESIIEQIQISEIHDIEDNVDNYSFLYDYIIDDEDEEAGYEFKFEYGNETCRVSVSQNDQYGYGFYTDYIYDSVTLWEGNTGEICRFIIETCEDLSQEDDTYENLSQEDDTYEYLSQEDDTYEYDTEKIDYKDFFIHSDYEICGHEYIKVEATVPIYSNKSVKLITFTADYCAECGIYYIPEHIYINDILPNGRLLCQVMSLDQYLDYKKEIQYNGELKPQGLLNMLGYTVNAKDDLSADERRTILRYAIEAGVVSKN